MLRFSKGFTIIEMLVTIAVLGIAMVGLTRMQVLGMRANKSSAIRLNALDVKRTITNYLSCEKTFESFGPTRPIACTGPVTLKDKNGNALTNNDKIDEWTIEASCESLGSPPTNGLSIYAIQPGKTDPLRGIPLDRNHPSGTLFSREVRLCRDYFIATPSGQVGVSPGGKCKSYSSAWNRNDSDVVSSSSWKSKKFVCPTEFPLVVSIQSTGGCNSSMGAGSMGYSNGATYFNTAVCSVIFLWEASAGNPSQAQAAYDQCQAISPGIDPGQAMCFYSCCNL